MSRSKTQIFTHAGQLTAVDADQMAKKQHLYEQHYTVDNGRYIFVRYRKSHIASNGNLNNAQHLGCKPSLAKLIHKIELPEEFNAKFGCVVYALSPKSGNIWTVRLCLYNSVKNLGLCGWIPSFATLDDACKGAAQIVSDHELLHQLLWQCSGYKKVTVSRPARMQDFAICVDNCDMVQWDAQKKTFIHPDDGAKSDDDFEPDSCDSDVIPMPYFGSSSSSSSSSSPTSPTPPSASKRKQKRKRPTQSVHTRSPSVKRTKPLADKMDTLYFNTETYGVVQVTFEDSDCVFGAGKRFKDQQPDVVFKDFDLVKALETSADLSRAFKLCKMGGPCEIEYHPDGLGIVVKIDGNPFIIPYSS